MKTNLLFVFLVAGCGVEGVGVQEAALGGFTFDSTALSPAPAGGLPQTRLSARSFGDDAITHDLIQTDEKFATGWQLNGRVGLDSPSWKYERDPLLGQVLAIRQLADGPAIEVDESLLRSRALGRLASWGIPAGELGPVWQKHAMVQDRDASGAGAPMIHGYKTFVLRALNGVVVQGHRAVVTHGVDGSFRRALVKWPALAASGHLLHTPLTPSQIEERARTALEAAGESSGAVTLRYQYVPKYNAAGEAVLTLRVAARLPSVTAADGVTEEPREIDVDVSATP